MGRTRVATHRCGYRLVLEEVVDAVDVGDGLHLPNELRALLRRDPDTERCSLPVGTLLYWYDGVLDMEDAELAKREVKSCPNCGSALPLGKQATDERENPVSDDDLEARLPPLVGRVRVTWSGERFVFRFSDDQELVYTQEECDPIYTTLYEQRALLAGASYSIIPTPDGSMAFRISGEGAVLLLAQLRDIRHELGIPDPPDNPWFSGFPERGESNGLLS